jgi:hypothetical protein
MKSIVQLFIISAILGVGFVTSAAAQSSAGQSAGDQVPAPPPAEAAPAEPAPEEPGAGQSNAPGYQTSTAAQGLDMRRTANNVLSVELAGNAGIYSVNYERFILDSLAARIGFGYISLSASSGGSSASASILFVPLMASYMGIGSADHKLELGAGPLFVNASAKASGIGSTAGASASGFGVAGTATIGYRYVPHDGGFNFKAAFTPIFSSGGFLPWFGLGLGYVF